MTTLMRTPVHALARYVYVPFMLLGLNGVGIALTAAGAPKYWLLSILALAIAVSFLVERIIPYEVSWNHERDDTLRDRIHVVVNETVVAIAIADISITIVHLASHKISILWRFHAVHHSITRFYGLNGRMKHPPAPNRRNGRRGRASSPDRVAGQCRLGPCPRGRDPAAAAALQRRLPDRSREICAGPQRGHRFHHLKWAGIGDVNFGLFTLISDHLMRTCSYDPTRRFDSTQLGMAGKPDYPTG